jgi:hypothetical protein
MILCNSLLVQPRHVDGVGIIIRDDLQGQEIMKLNNKPYTTIYNIKDSIRSAGFVFEAGGNSGNSKWFFKTQSNTYNIVLGYHKRFSTTYRLSDLEHYWLCPHCMSAVPDTWTKCIRCK